MHYIHTRVCSQQSTCLICIMQRKLLPIYLFLFCLIAGYYYEIIEFRTLPLLPPVWSFANLNATFYDNKDYDKISRNFNESEYYFDDRRPRWITHWAKKGYEPYTIDFLATCPELNCKINYDNNKVHLSDAVLFHLGDFRWNSLPAFRHSKQYYIFHTLESPYHSYFSPEYGRNFFNITMTYRKDSDFYFPYGAFRKKLNMQSSTSSSIDGSNLKRDLGEFIKNVTTIVKNKTKMVAWWVSNCNTESKRENLVHSLGKLIAVDIFGECGKLECSRENSNCSKMLDNDYRFYLSLENSVCPEYVTEKLFSRIKNYVVPIVLTKKMAPHIFPPMSVISVDEFRNVEQLAAYLKFLSKNVTAYLDYFTWRYDYDIIDTYGRCGKPSGCGYCDLCKFLHQRNLPKKILPDAYNWWHEKVVCKTDLVTNFLASNKSQNRFF